MSGEHFWNYGLGDTGQAHLPFKTCRSDSRGKAGAVFEVNCQCLCDAYSQTLPVATRYYKDTGDKTEYIYIIYGISHYIHVVSWNGSRRCNSEIVSGMVESYESKY